MRSLKQTKEMKTHARPDACGQAGVAEIVTFRLTAGANPPEFLQAAQAMAPVLQKTGAARRRTLSVDAEGLWTDHIVWTGMAEAKEAAEAVMQDPAAAPFMAMIDPHSVSLRHAVIEMSQTLESDAPD